jgi:hypothetical protein
MKNDKHVEGKMAIFGGIIFAELMISPIFASFQRE